MALIALSCAGALIAEYDKQGQILAWLSWHDLFDSTPIDDRSVFAPLQSGQWWRVATPMFLHFSLIHLLFNMLWLWDLGRRISFLLGPIALLGLVLGSAILSNGAQAWVTSSPLFGGMSGVVYALLGFCWIWDKLNPKYHFRLPSGLIWFMLAWLALGYSGLLDTLLGVSIANTAHAGGLVCGIVAALLTAPFLTAYIDKRLAGVL